MRRCVGAAVLLLGSISWIAPAVRAQVAIVEVDIEYGIATRADFPLPLFSRCIRFELTGCTSSDFASPEVLIEFAASGTRRVPAFSCEKDGPSRTVAVYKAVGVEFTIPAGDYDCLTARDPSHTLASVNSFDAFVKTQNRSKKRSWR